MTVAVCVLIAGLTLCVGYVLGSFVTANLMKQKLYDALLANDSHEVKDDEESK